MLHPLSNQLDLKFIVVKQFKLICVLNEDSNDTEILFLTEKFICSAAWKCQFHGDNKKPTLVLEFVASQDTWISHLFIRVSEKNE